MESALDIKNLTARLLTNMIMTRSVLWELPSQELSNVLVEQFKDCLKDM